MLTRLTTLLRRKRTPNGGNSRTNVDGGAVVRKTNKPVKRVQFANNLNNRGRDGEKGFKFGNSVENNRANESENRARTKKHIKGMLETFITPEL